MLKLAAGFIGKVHQQIAQLVAFGVLLKVPLHHRIANCGINRGFHHQWMAVAVTMNSDSGNHVQLHTAVCQFDKRSVADPAGKVGKE